MNAYLITGGAGFIGSVYTARLLARGEKVTIYDNLSRPGCQLNISWLQESHGENAFDLVVGDLSDQNRFETCLRQVQPDVIVHLGGQVAVTTSVSRPRLDFESNALGTFNVLEAARQAKKPPVVVYASTNKVYGNMDSLEVEEAGSRFRYSDLPNGVPETYPLDFHSPYGCSKGAGDQYARDYHRIYGLPTVVFRQSCIYGPRQFGMEDQGWVAWFIIALLTGKPITIFGNGKQVRDVLYIDDLLDAYDASITNIDRAAGQVYNVGGGMNNTISIWAEFGPILEKLVERPIPVRYSEWRPGDQKIYVSDIRKARRDLGWNPQVSVESGIPKLFNWAEQNLQMISQIIGAEVA